MGIGARVKKTINDYEPLYWVVISLELLERGAYYGIMGYFPVHLMINLGFSGTVYGILYAILVFLLYFVPIVASSLAKKFGYKTILTLAFIIIIPSYFAMTFLKTPLAFFFPILAWGIGAGAFKPMVSATIAHTTDHERRNSAYSIYYLSINWGSLISMVAIGFLIPEHFAQLVFIVGAVLITANLIITIFFFRNPVERDPSEKISTAFKNMVRVLSDGKFALLLIIYSGFFFVFSSMHTFLPVYWSGFGIQPLTRFTAPLMTAFNPLTIVIMGPFLSRFMDRFESLKLMITGILIFCAGLVLIGMFPIWYLVVIGIIIFSIGEFLTHPNFISYVSKIAPDDKVALYMGYAFLPSAAGNVFGSVFGGVMWDHVAVGSSNPSLFWSIYIGIGLFTMANFLLYNRFFGPKRKEIKAERRPTIWTSKFTVITLYGIIALVVFAGTSTGTLDYIADDEDDDFGPGIEYDTASNRIVMPGTRLQEGGSNSHTFTIPESNVVYVNITMTWTDESDPPGRPRIRQYENLPDTFSIEYEPCNSTLISDSGSNSVGTAGNIELSQEYDGAPDFFNGTGEHSLTVTLDEAGNFVPGVGVLGIEDDGNDYELFIQYSYLILSEE